MLTSPRLRYRRLALGDLEVFHALVTDEHVRRYLLDGELVPRAWAEAEVAASDRLFASQGIGLWLVDEGERTVGFCGFRVFPEIGPEPELLYALLQPATGRGLATEMATALVAFAPGPLRASVDEVNAASARVLEKVGFRRSRTVPGAFGPMHLYER